MLYADTSHLYCIRMLHAYINELFKLKYELEKGTAEMIVCMKAVYKNLNPSIADSLNCY